MRRIARTSTQKQEGKVMSEGEGIIDDNSRRAYESYDNDINGGHVPAKKAPRDGPSDTAWRN